jgi:selenocysteine lyase/cysteine desulfurase
MNPSLTELVNDESRRREEFPVTQSSVFLAHAAVSPLPRRVAEAVRDCAARSSRADQEDCFGAEDLRETRRLAARLLGAEPGEIALVGPTSLGLSYVAAGLAFAPGDNVLIYFDDYPSNVYPWMALESQGVEVRRLRVSQPGCIQLEHVTEQIDNRTRLVALASAHFLTGWRVDLPAIGAALRNRGILFCVDAIQTLGAFPTTVEHVDFLAADAHKWLLGPCAAGILYVRRGVQDQLRPVTWGWHNVQCPEFVAQETLVFRPDARRYEAGSQNLLGAAGLRAALQLILEWDVDRIASAIRRHRAWLVDALEQCGFAIVNARPPEERTAGILSCWQEGADMAGLHGRLQAAGVVVSLRTDRNGRHYLRFSPHAYNTEAELRRATELLRAEASARSR